MTDLDLDALIAEARDWAATVPLGKPAAREVDRGILFARRLAGALEASVARIREAEAEALTAASDALADDEDMVINVALGGAPYVSAWLRERASAIRNETKETK